MDSESEIRFSDTLRQFGRDVRGLGLSLAIYAGVLALLVVGMITIWNDLPQTVAQVRQVAIAAGWMADPPKLRGSL